jgi:hypothetical protein
MSDPRLDAVLKQYGIPQYVDDAGEAALARSIASGETDATDQPNSVRLPRLAFVYESQGIATFQRSVANPEEEALYKEMRGYFSKAFDCWRAMLSLPQALLFSPTSGTISDTGLALVQSELAGEPLRPELTLAFRLSVSGLLSQRSAETRLELKRFTLPLTAPSTTQPTVGWRERVSEHTFAAFALLVRKDGGWRDINNALSLINDLRQLQQDYEDSYLSGQGEPSDQTKAAVELVGLYHLAQMVTMTGEYLRDGKIATPQLNLRIDRHRDRAISAFSAAQWMLMVHVTDLLWVGCRELARNSIWTHVAGLGQRVREFAALLASQGRPNPVIELWPSQQAALSRNLLDPYRRAVLVEMPTSAGKTLLAKFAIVNTKALNPDSLVAYIVPTRALVNQVTLDLRADLHGMGLIVEQAVPAYELDPLEDRLLQKAPDVLVTTPEKLDLLVRKDHPSTRNISLVIADEAHNIRERGRGPRLELLLGILKRDQADVRFLLLSPFLPNDNELVTWLGEDRALPPIVVDWKPGHKVVGTIDVEGRGQARALIFETLPAADNQDMKPGTRIQIGTGAYTNQAGTISGLTKATVQALVRRGSILVLCRGQGTAITRAKELASELPERPASPEREAVCRYLDAELGRESTLSQCLKRGVAYHHAGISHEARWLVEWLIRSNLVDIVCGTTTLAQGVNFPITTVVVETLDKGRNGRLNYEDFWNIAGRAGRTLVDTLGVVAFPAPTQARRQEYTKFLQGEAQAISSQLAELISRIDEIGQKFDLETVRNFPQLSVLLQFLAHAMKVSGSLTLAEEVEDVLRDSLVYNQLRREDPRGAGRLVELCRSYLWQLRDKQGILVLADQTGFATPSVLRLLRERDQSQELAGVVNWEPDRLFGPNTGPLRQRVEAIANLPEMQLGSGSSQPFNSERVARILRDWVQGDNLDQLSRRYPVTNEEDQDKRVTEFSKYLFSQLLGQASWGIGALESVCLAGSKVPVEADVGYVPSMIFFGVKRKEAVWLRTVGVPRIVADSLAQLWERRGGGEPGTYEDLRNWVAGLSDPEWRHALPANGALTPADMRILWHQFAG